ncbi:hypothetical protein D5018_10395 [Parashewanella curva]|uniref:Uncharacterized protein n=1 Tax=Parashewanella curva TaxID=2338552 RepID=A0A3L8PY79_9GAMM|nr:hypothetical protein [Parashewanella curva]RLV59769.1 hypothetical protein D5018_10395 [Parashewanella curva]
MVATIPSTEQVPSSSEQETPIECFDPQKMNMLQFTQQNEFKTIKSELHAHLTSLSSTLAQQHEIPDNIKQLEQLAQLTESAPANLTQEQFERLFSEFCVEMKAFNELFHRGTYVENKGVSKLLVVKEQCQSFDIDNPDLTSDLKRINQQFKEIENELDRYQSKSEKVFKLIQLSEQFQDIISRNLETLPPLTPSEPLHQRNPSEVFQPDDAFDIEEQLPHSHDLADSVVRQAEELDTPQGNVRKLKDHHTHLTFLLCSRVGFPQSEAPDAPTPKYDESFILELLHCVKTTILTKVYPS